MIDVKYVQTLAGALWGRAMKSLDSTLDKVAKFDYSKLIPRARSEKYSYGTAGFEFTWKVGLGVGLGLGVWDVWFGWPRNQESLHTGDCRH